MKIKSSTPHTSTPQHHSPLKRIAGLALALCANVLVTPSLNAAPNDTLNAADVKFIKEEAAAGRSVVKLAELAVQKAAHPDIKALAQTLVTDHTGANSELSALATKKGVDISAVVDPDTATTFQDLEKVSGSDFDKAFLDAAIKDHKTCIENFQSASTEARDGDLKMWVIKMTPVLQGHLALAEKLQSK